MTPNEIQNKRFDRGMSGYRMEEVHIFLDEAADYARNLIAERDELEKKLEVLADKLEQYREDEDSLRAALIGAQKLGDSVVRESKKKAEQILEDAARQADSLVGEARKNIDREEKTLAAMKERVTGFRAQILELYKQHIEMIQNIPYEEKPARARDAAPAPATQEAEETPAQGKAFLFEDEQMTIEEGEAGEENSVLVFDDIKSKSHPEEKGFPKRKSKFGQLSDYFGDKNPVQREE